MPTVTMSLLTFALFIVSFFVLGGMVVGAIITHNLKRLVKGYLDVRNRRQAVIQSLLHPHGEKPEPPRVWH